MNLAARMAEAIINQDYERALDLTHKVAELEERLVLAELDKPKAGPPPKQAPREWRDRSLANTLMDRIRNEEQAESSRRMGLGKIG